jgi:hypothetical protein
MFPLDAIWLRTTVSWFNDEHKDNFSLTEFYLFFLTVSLNNLLFSNNNLIVGKIKSDFL